MKQEMKPIIQEDLYASPFRQLEIWLEEAKKAGIIDSNAMALATCGDDKKPSVRSVLLKDISEHALFFFTNYQSRKGEEIRENSHVGLMLYWREFNRQVIIDGTAHKTSREESEAYFATRPRGSQLAAWVSEMQGDHVNSRHDLEQRMKVLEQEYEGKDVPCPPYWGGFKVKPEHFEFWQGREHRLHDRFLYRPHEDHWVIERLSP